MTHLITSSDNLLLTTVATGGVLLTTVVFDDKSLRVSDLDKVVWVLLRRYPLIQVSIIKKTRMTATYAKHRLHVS